MRNLKSTDIFKMTRIITELDMKDEIKAIALKVNKASEIESLGLGFDLIYSIMEKASREKSEKKIYEFVADIAEMEVAEAEDMDPVGFIDLIEDLASKEQWRSFFSRVAELLDRK